MLPDSDLRAALNLQHANPVLPPKSPTVPPCILNGFFASSVSNCLLLPVFLFCFSLIEAKQAVSGSILSKRPCQATHTHVHEYTVCMCVCVLVTLNSCIFERFWMSKYTYVRTHIQMSLPQIKHNRPPHKHTYMLHGFVLCDGTLIFSFSVYASLSL